MTNVALQSLNYISNDQINKMWNNACFLTRLVASSVRVSEAAGNIIKTIMNDGDLKIINKAKKGDKNLQTEADRMAQFVIEKSLQEKFNNKLKIIGEEDVLSEVSIRELNVSPEVLEIDSKCSNNFREIEPEDVVVWVDPLDGTYEFTKAVKEKLPFLEHVTVLIGIAYKGQSIAGVIHQPYYNNSRGRTIWGIKEVGIFENNNNNLIVVTTQSHSTEMIQNTLDALKKAKLLTTVERVGGAGFKVIRCLEEAAAYVFASGHCKKWDTAATEAILEAAGGKLTDISGRKLYYGADAQLENSGGVLATAPWINHQDYVENIPINIKDSLTESVLKT